MGGSQSRQEDVPFDLFYCNCWQGACHDTTTFEKEQMEYDLDGSNSNGGARYRMQFANANFDLDAKHPSSPPYLGTSYWEVKPPSEEEKEEPSNLLDVSHTEPHTMWNEESNINNHNNHSNMITPPQTPKRTITTAANPQPCLFENWNKSSAPVSSPRPLLRESASNVSDSCSTIRTATTTSTINSSSMEHLVTSVDTNSKRGGIEVTFTPRRLFGDLPEGEEEEEEEDQFLNPTHHPLTHPNLLQLEQLTVHEITPPPTPHSVRAMDTSSNPIYCGDTACDMDVVLCDRNHRHHCLDSPRSQSSTMDDPSILLRNGVLVQAADNPVSPSRSTIPTMESRFVPDGIERGNEIFVNTLPSTTLPIHLKITESYAGYSSSNLKQHHASGNEEGCDGNDGGAAGVNTSNLSLLSDVGHEFFSYDPYFSVGEYTISTSTGHAFGNGLSLKMGEQYMTLMDRNGRVWGVTRSRHTFLPSGVIYSPKAKYQGQIPSSHRPSSDDWCGDGNDGRGGGAVELYPWALVKKEGRGMEHDVRIHLVAEPGMQSGEELVGGLFCKKPTFRCRHGLDENKAHAYTIVYRIESDGETKSRIKGNATQKESEIPCCMMLRDPIHRDLVDVTIAPGIDPLLIVCYLAVHFKMVS
jgi:hypothetical protein